MNHSNLKSGYIYDLDQRRLSINNKDIPAIDYDHTDIGNCHKCNSAILSLSHHINDKEHIIISKCEECGNLAANIYDYQWNWLKEVPLLLSDQSDDEPKKERCELEVLNSIPMV